MNASNLTDQLRGLASESQTYHLLAQLTLARGVAAGMTWMAGLLFGAKTNAATSSACLASTG